jgi:hypothetical protein
MSMSSSYIPISTPEAIYLPSPLPNTPYDTFFPTTFYLNDIGSNANANANDEHKHPHPAPRQSSTTSSTSKTNLNNVPLFSRQASRHA